MKKKIAILLATIMTATMVPVTSAFADSSNSVNQVVTIKDGDFDDSVILKIQPSGEVKMDDTIILTLQNAEFDEADMDKKYEDYTTSSAVILKNSGIHKYDYNALAGYAEDSSYDYLKARYEEQLDAGPTATPVTAFDNSVGKYMIRGTGTGSADLPYKLRRNGKKELEVTLFALPDELSGETYEKSTKPAYRIPIPFTASGTGDVTVSIDANGTSIRGGVSYTIASSASKSGDTVTTVDDIKVGSDDISLETINIKETVYGTFEPEKEVTLKLNSGFEFKKGGSYRYWVEPGINTSFQKFQINDSDIDENTITFKLPEIIGDGETEKRTRTVDGKPEDYTVQKTSKPGTIKITGEVKNDKGDWVESGLWVTPEDDDNFGEIKLTVSGSSAGISKETIVVAERGDYGFTMRAVEDATTIYSGRKGYELNGITGDISYNAIKNENPDYDDDERYTSYMGEEAAREYDSDDYESATIEFAEITADTWNQNRKLKFNVPDEAKIYGFEIDEEEDCDIKEDSVSITNDGHTLEIDLNKGGSWVDENEASKFELKLNLSIDANHEGDIPLSVEGAGMSEGDVEDVVIAKAVKPISLETSSTKTNMGYQKVDTADITLTEAEGGMLVKNGRVEIAIDSIYGEDELGFADENIDYEIEGDLKIKTFKVSKGVISFIVDSASVDASKITIKNVKIGTTRSIPWGSYGLKVSGSALINNYSEGLVDIGCEATSNNAELGLGFFDDNEAIKFANYIDVITETGTLDKVVKVTIGEKTIVVDGQNYEMDVEPYIQAESSSTMVPLRFVMVALGVDSESVGSFDESNKVSFDATTKTATIFYAAGTNMTTIQFTAGSNTMMVNGAAIPMENGVKAEIKDGRMFVPFRAIGTAINVKVGWDAETRTATYNG